MAMGCLRRTSGPTSRTEPQGFLDYGPRSAISEISAPSAPPARVMWEFDTPLTLPDTVGVLAIATCNEDHVGQPVNDLETMVQQNKRIALREVQVNTRADVIIGVVVTLLGLAVVGGAVAGGLKAGKVI